MNNIINKNCFTWLFLPKLYYTNNIVPIKYPNIIGQLHVKSTHQLNTVLNITINNNKSITENISIAYINHNNMYIKRYSTLFERVKNNIIDK